MEKTLFHGILGYGQGFHGVVELLLTSDRRLRLLVDGRCVYSSAAGVHLVPKAIDGTGWAEAAFQL